MRTFLESWPSSLPGLGPDFSKGVVRAFHSPRCSPQAGDNKREVKRTCPNTQGYWASCITVAPVCQWSCGARIVQYTLYCQEVY
jgi:hypothetical protein